MEQVNLNNLYVNKLSNTQYCLLMFYNSLTNEQRTQFFNCVASKTQQKFIQGCLAL